MLAGCNDKPFVSKVEYDKQMGMDLQISGTPTVFVNGRQMVGLPATAEFLSWTVDDELEWKRHGGGWSSAK